MITEVTFIHERGQVFGLYWTTQTIMSSALNLASSYEVDALGWRWYYWVFAIAVAVGLVLAVFFGFETRFARPAINLDGRIIITDEFGVTGVISDDEAQEYLEQHGAEAASEDDGTPKKSYGELLMPWSEPHQTPWKMIVTSWVHMAQSMTSPAILFAVFASSICLGCTVCISDLRRRAPLVRMAAPGYRPRKRRLHHWRPTWLGILRISWRAVRDLDGQA